MIIDGGHLYVYAHVSRKIRRGIRADSGKAMPVSYVRVLRVLGDELDVEVFRSNAWRKARISAGVVRDDMDAVRQWFDGSDKECATSGSR